MSTIDYIYGEYDGRRGDSDSSNSSGVEEVLVTGRHPDYVSLSGTAAYNFSQDWQNYMNRYQQSMQYIAEGAFNFSGIPTVFNTAIDVHVAINMGDYATVGTAVLGGVAELGTKKANTVKEVADLAKDAKKSAAKVEKALDVKGVKTPYGVANQSTEAAALTARGQVQNGATLYRVGTTGKSQTAEAQFWSLENPLKAGYAQRYGIPASNVKNANFIETATLKPGTSFVTRPAPAVGANGGGDRSRRSRKWCANARI